VRRPARPHRRTAVLLATAAVCAGTVATAPPSSAALDTAYGAVVKAQPGQTYAQALAASEQRYGGKLGVIRYFDADAPDAWSLLTPKLTDHDAIVSFRLPPAEVVTGMHDARLTRWFRSAPRDRVTWFSYLHEPEDNIAKGEFTRADFLAAYRRISTLAETAAPTNANLRPTLILMCYTVNPRSGRSWRDYFPGRAYVDVIGWDCYNHGVGTAGYGTPQQLLDRAVATTREAGVAFGVAELGSLIADGDDGTGRAAWLRAHARYLEGVQAEFVSYFDTNGKGTDYRLLDAPSRRAWRAVVSDQQP
jgi:hypothetical protein